MQRITGIFLQPKQISVWRCHSDWVNFWVIYWLVPSGVLVSQDVQGREIVKVLISSICYFPWYKYSHHSQSQIPNMMSLNGTGKRWHKVFSKSQESQPHTTVQSATPTIGVLSMLLWTNVMLWLRVRRLPTPGSPQRLFSCMAASSLRSADSNFPDIQGCLWPCFQSAASSHNYLPLGFAEVPEVQPGRGHFSLLFCLSVPTCGESTLGLGSEMGWGQGPPHFLSKCFSMLCPISSFFFWYYVSNNFISLIHWARHRGYRKFEKLASSSHGAYI